MDILHVCPKSSFSGLERYALEVATWQKQQGHDVGFVCEPGSRLETECQNVGIQTVPIAPSKGLARLKASRTLCSQIAKLNPKVIHLHSTQFVKLLPPLFFKKQTGQKVILQTHIWIDHTKTDVFHRWLYSPIDEVWCSSQAQKSDLQRALPVKAGAIRIIRYGRPAQEMAKNYFERAKARDLLGLTKADTVFGTVNRIDPAKGTRELFDAGREVLQKHPRAYLVFIGGPTPDLAEAKPYWDSIQRDHANLPPELKSRILFTGNLEDAFRYLPALDVFILASYKETFSLAVLDAQCAGLPVLATNSGGTPDMVQPQKTGWLVPPKSTQGLVQGLDQAFEQQEAWSKLGAAGRDLAYSRHDSQNIQHEILGAYGLKKR